MSDLRIRSALALPSGQIWMAIHEQDEEEPGTTLLGYDFGRHQWIRHDVPTNIHALADTGQTHVAAIGNEGVAYYLDGTNEPIREVIEGAGLEAEHGEGRGYLMDATLAGGAMWAVGYTRQLFQRSGGDDWQLIEDEEVAPGSPQHSGPHLLRVAGLDTGEVYTFGEDWPEEDREARDKISKEWTAALISEDEVRIAAAEAAYFAPLPQNEQRGFHFDGTDWHDIAVPEVAVDAVFAEDSERVWLGTASGGMFVGNAEDGFDQVGETDEGIVSITRFGERYIVATRDRLVSFTPDGDSFHGTLEPLVPKLGAKTRPLPLRVQGFETSLVYVDYHLGIYIWDGADEWTPIPIPGELRPDGF